MLKFLLSLLLFTTTAFVFAQESFTVTAKSGLTIRKEPSPNGQKIGKLEYGMVVEVIEKTDFTLTLKDNGKQVRGNWVKVSFGHIPKVISKESSGFVFDGYLKKVAANTSSHTTFSSKELELYKLTGSENTPNGKTGFVSLTDAYAFTDDDGSLVIAKEHLGEKEFNDDNYHVLGDRHRTRFLKSLGIRETDSIYIYHFLTDAIFTSKVGALPVVAKVNPYGAQMPVRQHDYMIGFEIGEAIVCIDDIKNYYATTLVYIGQENPFVRGQLRPVLWEKVDPNRFPISKQIIADSTEAEENPLSDTFEFTTGDLRYFVQNRTRDGRLYARHFKVLASDGDTVLFENIYNPGEGAGLLTLNTVRDKKQNNRITIWTGKLFKNKPPIITDLSSHSFGCPEIYFLEQSERPISIRCDNRH